MFETPLPDISNERDKHAAATQQPLRQQPPPVSAVAKIDLMALALSRFGEWRAGAAALVERYRAVVFDLSTPMPKSSRGRVVFFMRPSSSCQAFAPNHS